MDDSNNDDDDDDDDTCLFYTASPSVLISISILVGRVLVELKVSLESILSTLEYLNQHCNLQSFTMELENKKKKKTFAKINLYYSQ